MSTKTNDAGEEQTSLLYELASVMAGDFDNYRQAISNPKTYARIRIFFRPLPWEFFSGIGFYSEQVYEYDLWSPYRQGVHRLVERDTEVYIENYRLLDPEECAGAGHNRDILLSIDPKRIQRRANCSMVFVKDGEMFRGSVEPGNNCWIEKKGVKTYLVSDVELTATTWISWDRGIDPDTQKQVWGSAAGPLKFDKKTSYAAELPLPRT